MAYSKPIIIILIEEQWMFNISVAENIDIAIKTKKNNDSSFKNMNYIWGQGIMPKVTVTFIYK